MYTIQEVCEKTGFSAHTLRYYEKEGLLTGIQRRPGGIRQYSAEDLEWLGLLSCLKNTGMALQEIARFVHLAHQGNETLTERVELLKEHRGKIVERIAEMQRYLEKINWKVDYFSDKLREHEKRASGNGN